MNALQRIRAALADHRYRPLLLSGAATVVALVGVLAFALLRDERTPGTPTEPPGFVLSPAGTIDFETALGTARTFHGAGDTRSMTERSK